MSDVNHTEASTSRTLKVDDLTIHYHDTGGPGDVVVFVHGGGPGVASWNNYQDNIPVFAKAFRVLAFDIPHFGKSDKPKDDYLNAEMYVGVLAKALQALGVEKAHFIGIAMGGSISLNMALAFPAMVDRLVVMGAGGSIPVFTVGPTESAKVLRAYYQGEGPSRPKLEAFVRLMVSDPACVTDAFLDDLYQASLDPGLMTPKEPKHLDTMFGLWKRVDQIKHKTLLAYGKEDRACPWDAGLVFLRLMANADLHVFAGAGHWVQMERPAEFNSTVMNFLAAPA